MLAHAPRGAQLVHPHEPAVTGDVGGADYDNVIFRQCREGSLVAIRKSSALLTTSLQMCTGLRDILVRRNRWADPRLLKTQHFAFPSEGRPMARRTSS
jgi:hypothetical protein